MKRLLSPVKSIPGVFTDGSRLLTMNAAPGQDVYGEELVLVNGLEYRVWNPYRSKLAAVILLGTKRLGIDRSSKVLYLGAASGTTASHVSDIVVNGVVHCVEFSERSFRDLVRVCETRRNMMPYLADANAPEAYAHVIEGVEFVYQDIAQRNQVDIFVRNMAAFEAERGILMLKSRSVDVNRIPKDVFADVRKALVSKGLGVRSMVPLERYSKDHACFIVEA
jgi:fibrillarin-like pre-rRNA processing protein